MAKKADKTKKKAVVKAKPAKAAKSKAKPAPKAKPVAKKAAKPVAKKAAKPVAKKAVKPVAKKAAKPVAKKAAKPVAKKAVKKAAAPVAKKAAKPVAKPVAKKAAKPVAKPAAKPVAKPIAKPAAKPVAKKPEVKQLVKVNPQPVKKADKNQTKPVAQPLHSVKQKVEMKEVKKETVKTENKPVFNKPVIKTNAPMFDPNEPQMRYSDEELKEFKIIIDKKLEAAREELKYLKETLDNHTESQAGNKAWNMEEGTDTSDMETLMNQISRMHQYIRNLELALVRVENKTYGICRATGKLIDKNRLKVVPHATLSLEAKMSRKSDDTSPGATLVAPTGDFSEGFED